MLPAMAQSALPSPSVRAPRYLPLSRFRALIGIQWLGRGCQHRRTGNADRGDLRLQGALHYATSKPDGAPLKMLDVSMLNAMGSQPMIGLCAGSSITPPSNSLRRLNYLNANCSRRCAERLASSAVRNCATSVVSRFQSP